MTGTAYTPKYEATASVTFTVAPDGTITDAEGSKVTFHDYAMTARSRTTTGRAAKQAEQAAAKLARLEKRQAKIKADLAKARRAAKKVAK